MVEEGGNFKKKIKPGLIELDPAEPVIVVHYDTLVLDQDDLDEQGNPKVKQRKQSQRRIKLKTFKATSTTKKFANEIVDKCKYIQSSKVDHVCNLLEDLKKRLILQESKAEGAGGEEGGGGGEDSEDDMKVVKEAPVQNSSRPANRPSSAARTRQKGINVDEEREREKERERVERMQTKIAEKEAIAKKEEAEREAAEKAKEEKQEEEQKLREKIEAEMKAKYDAEVAEEKAKLDEERRKAKEETAVARQAAQKAMEEAQAQVRLQLEHEKKIQDKLAGKHKKKKDKQALKILKSMNKKKKNKEEKASMDNIDNYTEKLYEEDMNEKIVGTAKLLELVQAPINLEYFTDSDTILGALSRVLIEDRKKSTELVTNILEIFFCFSSFSQLHNILLQNKIGDTTMKIVDLEIKRYTLKAKEEDKDKKKLAKYMQRQERLLFVCFYILLNLAEDTDVEVKMTNRSIVKHLVTMLQRENEDRKFLDELHLLIVTFLKKLSIFAENKTEMAEFQTILKLKKFLHTENEDLLEAVLRLIYNLSFDEEHREDMIKCGMVPAFVQILRRPACREVAMRILYNVTLDGVSDDISHAVTGAIPMITQFVIQCPSQYVDNELISLAINLANDPQNVEMMCAGEGLPALVQRVSRTHDSLLIKLLRNISDHKAYRPFFRGFMFEFVGMAAKAQNHDFLVEVIALLANMDLPDIRFAEVIRNHGLLDFLMKHMVSGFADDDVLMAVIMLIGTISIDPDAAGILSNTRLIRMLYDILNEKTEDVDIVLQLVFTIYRLVLHHETRETIIKHENLTNCLLDLVIDPNKDIQRFANMCLDVIMEHDEEWREQIREKRFEMCNREWIEFVQNGSVPPFDQSQGGDMPEGYQDFYNTQYGYVDEEGGESMHWGEERHYIHEME